MEGYFCQILFLVFSSEAFLKVRSLSVSSWMDEGSTLFTVKFQEEEDLSPSLSRVGFFRPKIRGSKVVYSSSFSLASSCCMADFIFLSFFFIIVRGSGQKLPHSFFYSLRSRCTKTTQVPINANLLRFLVTI